MGLVTGYVDSKTLYTENTVRAKWEMLNEPAV